MKKRLLTALCLFALMATSTFVMAQEITITLNPGWTWISYTRADTLTFAEALGYFTPMEGDMINSQEHGSAVYRSGRWRGALQQFTPGVGYMYNSKRTESVSFVYTHAYQPEVNTLAVLGITSTSATVGGNLLNDGGATMRQCGICWSTNENPTINNSVATIGELTTGEYSLELTNLIPGTTYHARAFATNEIGTSYGEEVSFTTLEEAPPMGHIDGVFSINENGDQICFSQGNLQYQASTDIWQFAEHQWDYVGEDNANISSTYNGWIDLFGWGTSGFEHGAICWQPWSTSTYYANYYAYGNNQYHLFDQTGQADWGYNAISNGGNMENSGWRTLTQNEWTYLFNARPATMVNGTANARYAKAKVAGVHGIILFPNIYTHPSEIALPTGINNAGDTGWNENNYTEADFALMEANGAVFLPAAGSRTGTSVSNVGSYGNYWQSCHGDMVGNGYIYFNSGNFRTGDAANRCCGLSVRLVRNAASVPPKATTFNMMGGITNTTASVRGQFAGATVTECGICYRTEQGAETCVAAEPINNIFSVTLEGLTPNTTYFARAYATNETCTSYGDEVSFTTLEHAPATPEGTINGLFSVSATQQVYFSKGNLQYIGSAATPYWQFAEHQWDYLGNNGQGSTSQTVDRDLFGWGTSGYNHGPLCYQPWSTSTSYGQYGAHNGYLTGQSDWGHNAIAYGGNTENSGWRTMGYEEWRYVFDYRNTASGIRWAKGTVNEVNGLILLPDNWNAYYTIYTLNNTNDKTASFSSNIITAANWMDYFEANGAVFLPAGGYRYGTTINDEGLLGIYWSASNCDTGYAWYWYFSSDDCRIVDGYRYYGLGVRLVRNAE